MRERLETGFERWGRFVLRHPRAAIAVMLGLTLAAAVQLPGMRIDNSIQSFLKPGDPVLVTYQDFRRQFGMDQPAVLGIETPEVFELEFLERLAALHRALEERVPHVADVTSLVNARVTRERGGELVVRGLLDPMPRSADDLAALARTVRSEPLYEGILIAASGRLVTVSVRSSPWSAAASDEFDFGDDAAADVAVAEPRLLTDVENVAFMAGIREVAAEFEAPGFRIHIAGAPAMSERLDVVVREEVAQLVAFSFLAAVAILFALFRTVAGVLLPLTVVGCSVVCTVGAMVWLAIPLSITTVIVPSFLLMVGLCDSMHLLVIASQQLGRGASTETAVVHAMRHSGVPILMTSLTTAGGMISFQAAELAPVAYFGVVAPLGVMLALLFTLVLLPALLTVVHFHAPRTERRRTVRALDRLLVRCGDLATGRPWAVVWVSAGLALVFAFGATRLSLGQEELHWFPEREPLRQAVALLDAELHGILSVELLADAGAEGAWTEPARLRQLEQIARANEGLRVGELYAGKTVSLVDVVKEVHRALDGDGSASAALPPSREAVAQELLLFESAAPGELARVADEPLSIARVTVKVPKVDAAFYPEFLDRLEASVGATVGVETAVVVTGLAAVMSRIMAAVVVSMTTSYAIAFAIITPLMMLVIGSVRRGLLSMFPNLAPVIAVLGVMGYLDIQLDGFSLMIGCIIIGLAVDDTIHFVHGFRRHFERHGDVREAVRDTLHTTGVALLFTSLVLAAGCVSFLFGYMRIVAIFGGLIAFAIFVAFVADVILAPALLVLATRPGPADAVSPACAR